MRTGLWVQLYGPRRSGAGHIREGTLGGYQPVAVGTVGAGR